MISEQEILNASILIVDDQQSGVLLLDRILRGAGYISIESTTDPHDVCELHRKNHYDLILLDLLMPGMDGFQVMEGIKEIETDGYLPVQAVSQQSYSIQGRSVNMTTSVGVSIYPTHGGDAETLMKSADLALYEVKRTGKNDYRIAARTNLLAMA